MARSSSRGATGRLGCCFVFSMKLFIVFLLLKKAFMLAPTGVAAVVREAAASRVRIKLLVGLCASMSFTYVPTAALRLILLFCLALDLEDVKISAALDGRRFLVLELEICYSDWFMINLRLLLLSAAFLAVFPVILKWDAVWLWIINSVFSVRIGFAASRYDNGPMFVCDIIPTVLIWPALWLFWRLLPNGVL